MADLSKKNVDKPFVQLPEIDKYTKALHDAGCIVDSDYGGLALKDDPFSLDGCHPVKAYAGILGAAIQDTKDTVGGLMTRGKPPVNSR